MRTETASPSMLDTLPNVCELDCWFASVAPDYLAGLSEALLVVCKGNKVFEGGDRATWGEPNVRRDSRQWFSWRTCPGCESVVLGGQHGRRRRCREHYVSTLGSDMESPN